jgi:hypothetical protein
MIPVNPNVIAAGRRPSILDYGDWWTKTNDNIGSRGAESQRTGENNSYQLFMKHGFPFLVTDRAPSRNFREAGGLLQQLSLTLRMLALASQFS